MAAHDTVGGSADGRVSLSGISELELHECVGRGAFGKVYKATHTRLQQLVAVKVFLSFFQKIVPVLSYSKIGN
tara:strand:+ start:1428 stop:1646 length:219 start_codon:yes stop_codon:yes gene_type:complete